MIQNTNKNNKITLKLAMLPDSKFKQVMEVRPLPYATVQIAKALRSDVVQKSMMPQRVMFHLGLLGDQTQWLFGL